MLLLVSKERYEVCCTNDSNDIDFLYKSQKYCSMNLDEKGLVGSMLCDFSFDCMLVVSDSIMSSKGNIIKSIICLGL